MFCGALNRIVRKKSKLVCKLLLSEELDCGRLLLRLVPSSVLLCGLLRRKTREWRTPQPIADGAGKQNVLYQAFMVAFELRTSVFESLAYKVVHFYIGILFKAVL